MALQITEVSGTFSVTGELNHSTANILYRHMERVIPTRNDRIVLNLERVRHIDESAAYRLQELYLNAVRSNSALAIIGQENKVLLPVMSKTKTEYILSPDRI
ncbi:STAS domain-containing protein [Maribacter sp. 2-571]|uniref:STAS domain-containing protein n=1 Tax=Maribacter sp. 2-571 TaxID=3417569 RepID=UPI003D33BBFC